MNGHMIPRTAEEEAEMQAPYRDDLARWPDLHQMPEPEERPSGRLAGFVAWAAAVSLALAWAAWEVM